MNLYELMTSYESALARAIESATEDGAIDDEIAIELDALEMDLSDKIENTACLIKNIEAEAEAIKAEEKRLADRRRSLENRSLSIRSWLRMNLHGEKYTSARVAISYRKSDVVEISSIDSIPQEFKRVKTTVEADKIAIKQAIKNGIKVEGAVIVTNESMVLK